MLQTVHDLNPTHVELTNINNTDLMKLSSIDYTMGKIGLMTSTVSIANLIKEYTMPVRSRVRLFSVHVSKHLHQRLLNCLPNLSFFNIPSEKLSSPFAPVENSQNPFRICCNLRTAGVDDNKVHTG